MPVQPYYQLQGAVSAQKILGFTAHPTVVVNDLGYQHLTLS